MSVKPTANGWSLEVVRGKDVGHSFALNGVALVLGNALGGEPGIDLSAQEGNAPRRMAAKQAQLECSAKGLFLRDLDSPGGTFVNRQRLLPSQARPLQTGDVIQLGGVQLKVVAGGVTPSAKAPTAAAAPPPAKGETPPAKVAKTAVAPPPEKSGPLSSPFILASGATCRTWDDFLTVSAQRWPALREELISGRLAAFLTTAQRPDLIPSPQAPGSPDERLDAWLATLPTTQSSQPEIEVHPQTLVVRVVPGGGLTRQTFRITNTGYRLLRSTIRVEPVSATWLKLPQELVRAPVVTIDETDINFEVEIPETLDRPVSAALVIDGNGGKRRVEVRLERSASGTEAPPAGPAYVPGLDLKALIARRPVPLRIAMGVLAGPLVRGVVAAGAVLGAGPPLRGVLVLMGILGAVIAAILAGRRGEWRDVPSAMFAGAVGGALAAAIMLAATQAIEPRVVASSPAVACLVWAGLGAVMGAATAPLVPHQRSGERQP